MRRQLFVPCTLSLLLAVTLPAVSSGQQPSGWKQHEWDRPRPPVVQPVTQDLPAAVPADAVVLFGGDDLSAWQKPDGSEASWRVGEGFFEVVPGTGMIQTQQGFGDVQLHVEWASPDPPRGTNQDRGNSGVFLMGRYEIQVLDVYEAQTYADGQAGAIYGQYPPLANASRPPGEWQSYDIFFRRPRFRPDGTVEEPARISVMHNGILVQNNEVLYGATAPVPPYRYVAHANELPFTLQDHSHPVRFRNIWLRRLDQLDRHLAIYLTPMAPRPIPDQNAQAIRRPLLDHRRNRRPTHILGPVPA